MTCFLGVISWENKCVHEPAFFFFFFFFTSKLFFLFSHSLKDAVFLFLSSRQMGNYLQFFKFSVTFPPDNQWGLIGIQTLYLYKYYFHPPVLAELMRCFGCGPQEE